MIWLSTVLARRAPRTAASAFVQGVSRRRLNCGAIARGALEGGGLGGGDPGGPGAGEGLVRPGERRPPAFGPPDRQPPAPDPQDNASVPTQEQKEKAEEEAERMRFVLQREEQEERERIEPRDTARFQRAVAQETESHRSSAAPGAFPTSKTLSRSASGEHGWRPLLGRPSNAYGGPGLPSPRTSRRPQSDAVRPLTTRSKTAAASASSAPRGPCTATSTWARTPSTVFRLAIGFGLESPASGASTSWAGAQKVSHTTEMPVAPPGIEVRPRLPDRRTRAAERRRSLRASQKPSKPRALPRAAIATGRNRKERIAQPG